jgi:hypothetical protein
MKLKAPDFVPAGEQVRQYVVDKDGYIVDPDPADLPHLTAHGFVEEAPVAHVQEKADRRDELLR